MPKSSRELVDLILLGPLGDRRQLQDSPILGDVWMRYAADPKAALELLISPEKKFSAGEVAKTIAESVRDSRGEDGELAHVAHLQGFIAAKLTFSEIIHLLVPMSAWWVDRKVQAWLKDNPAESRIEETIPKVIDWAALEEDSHPEEDPLDHFGTLKPLDRFVVLASLILWASKKETPKGKSKVDIVGALAEAKDEKENTVKEVVADLPPYLKKPSKQSKAVEGERANERNVRVRSVWQISVNRRAKAALEKSIQAVKGDAVRNLFKVKCNEIGWAVLDSGIESGHPAFKDSNGDSRVVEAFDFTNIRAIISHDNLRLKPNALRAEIRKWGSKASEDLGRAVEDLQALAQDTFDGHPINWELARPFVTLGTKSKKPPAGDHGTHVAGIIGGARDEKKEEGLNGMCPDIQLYDFRILSKTVEDTEFAIIAAMQFIRYLNDRSGFMVIHGANLSLSIPHDVRNFACGRTPICEECERLVENGVVVVAAAGNLGYHSFETSSGQYDGYVAFSITDPGNADSVITVGATHRFWPHTYGVSFFSSRGPTGDGRFKPDLVAPGERIQSAFSDGGWGVLDGTSMAAPHVSGAAAMLMARYEELVGQPRRIKKILCETATDLGRERTFQGHGMLDVLRAFQKI